MVKVLIKIFLPFFLGSFFALWAFSFAHAEEVPSTPSDSIKVVYSAVDNISGTTSHSFNSTVISSFSPRSTYYGGSSFQNGFSVWFDSSATIMDGSNLNRSPRLNRVSAYRNSWNGSATATYTYSDFDIDLDTSSLTPGYYRYEVEFCFGFALQADYLVPGNNVYRDLNPLYTVSQNMLAIGDSENGMHCIIYYMGDQENIIYSNNNQNSGFRSDLVHFHMQSTFQIVDSVSSVHFDLSPMFDYMVNSFTYPLYNMQTGSTTVEFGFTNRFKSTLYSGVEPPVTPTPTVTPYPGQDTQESINQGVSNIEGQMNQLIDSLNPQVSPIPTPADFTIDETLFDELESLTLPDVSAAEYTFSSLWDIFDPIWWLLALLFSVTFVIGIFLYVLRGGFI